MCRASPAPPTAPEAGEPPPRVQGETETVFPGVPPLEDALAVLIIPHSAGWSGHRKPLPPLLQDKDTLEYFDKIFQLGAQLAAAANNLGVLGVAAAASLPRDAPPSPDTMEYLGRTIGQMNKTGSCYCCRTSDVTVGRRLSPRLARSHRPPQKGPRGSSGCTGLVSLAPSLR